MKRAAWFSAAMFAILTLPNAVNAQAVLPPEPAPLPQPLPIPQPPPGVSFLPPPQFLRPTQYSFNGPSSGTVTFVPMTTTFYQPGPGGNRLMTGTVITPVYGYVPGYYRDYYTPLFYRP